MLHVIQLEQGCRGGYQPPAFSPQKNALRADTIRPYKGLGFGYRTRTGGLGMPAGSSLIAVLRADIIRPCIHVEHRRAACGRPCERSR